jgi:CheY-like chemotaxis protein
MTMPIGRCSAPDQRSFAPGVGLRLPFATPAREALSVLVVDDEAEVLEELTVALGRRGLSVLSAGSARMALSILASRPDVGALVTDIRMPGMDGIALAEAALSGRRDADALEVLLVTGYASVAQGLAASRIGAFGVLRKPMRGADLAQLVAEALASAAQRRDANHPRTPQTAGALAAAPSPMAMAGLPLVHAQAGQAFPSLSMGKAAPRTHPAERRATPRPAQDGRADSRGDGQGDDQFADGLADDLADARALEDGLDRPRRDPVSAHALMGAVAAQLRARGATCSRRITLQPDADLAFYIDSARLLRVIDLLGRRAFGSQPGTAVLSLDAGAGQARLDLLLRPDAPEPVEPEPRPERGLPVAVARRLVAALGGQLDAWTIPTGGLRARLLLHAE